jgi:DNA-binding transcriptional MerR regulator
MSTNDSLLDIGQVVHLSGLPISTLHVWERHGVIAPAGRKGLRRQYEADILERIAAIVLYQRGGFSLAEIAGLLHPEAFAAGKDHLATKLEELRHTQRELEAAITGLEHALACPHPSPMECPSFVSMLADVLPID